MFHIGDHSVAMQQTRTDVHKIVASSTGALACMALPPKKDSSVPFLLAVVFQPHCGYYPYKQKRQWIRNVYVGIRN